MIGTMVYGDWTFAVESIEGDKVTIEWEADDGIYSHITISVECLLDRINGIRTGVSKKPAPTWSGDFAGWHCLCGCGCRNRTFSDSGYCRACACGCCGE